MMKMFKCVVVDDDEVDRLMVVSFIKRQKDLCLIGSFSNAAEALLQVDFNQVDAVFLDIDMDGMDGLSLRRSIATVPACIFITSYPEYAVDSFEVNTLDFIVKPIHYKRFEETVARLQTYMDIQQKAHLYENLIKDDYIYIREGHKETKITLHDVYYLEGLRDYTLLVTQDKKHCVLSSIGNLLKEIHFKNFIRVHRSFAVRKDLIHSYSSKEIFLTNNRSIPIGRSFRDSIPSLLC